MISIADLLALDQHPVTDYQEYEEVREAARRRNGGFIAPADLPRMEEVLRRRGLEWCQSVTGKPMLGGGLKSISATDAVMLLIADERNLTPPKPSWLEVWQAESAELTRAQEARRAAGLQADRDRWARALATCGVPVEVRPNMHGRRYGASWQAETLRHVVPLVDARSTRRLHRAGRPLCEVGHARQLGDPVDEPATCKGCLRYTAEIQPSQSGGTS
jgi:hypothetical protein